MQLKGVRFDDFPTWFRQRRCPATMVSVYSTIRSTGRSITTDYTRSA